MSTTVVVEGTTLTDATAVWSLALQMGVAVKAVPKVTVTVPPDNVAVPICPAMTEKNGPLLTDSCMAWTVELPIQSTSLAVTAPVQLPSRPVQMSAPVPATV